MSQRLEVSIFQELNYTKTFISSVMRTDIENGLGKIMINLVRDLTSGLDGLTYRGRIPDERTGHPLTDEEQWLKFGSQISLFGGSAFEMYRQNDDPRFAHVLPGLHDVDANLHLACFSENEHFEHPVSRESIDRLRAGTENTLEQPNSPLSFLLGNIVDLIKTSVGRATNRGDFKKEYELDVGVNSSVHTLHLREPDKPVNDPTCVHTEIIEGGLFRVKVVDEVGMMKVQVEVKPYDIVTEESVTDHVFELIIPIMDDSTRMEGFDSAFDIIQDIKVDIKERSFIKTTASLLDRAIMVFGLGDRKMEGKCAQDFLRILYLFLTELQYSSTWIRNKFNILAFPMRASHIIRLKMIETLGERATPLDIFLFVSSFIETCVRASTVKAIDVFRSNDSSHEFEEVIECFKDAFPASRDRSFVSSSDVRKIFEDHNLANLAKMKAFTAPKGERQLQLDRVREAWRKERIERANQPPT